MNWSEMILCMTLPAEMDAWVQTEVIYLLLLNEDLMP